MSYLVLSLDGGGIRSVLTAKLLERLESACPFLDRVELVAGASSGGIMALGLAKGLAPATLLDLFRNDGPRIFALRDALDAVVGKADEVFRADYDNEQGLRRSLAPHLEGVRLRDLKKRVLIPTVDLCGTLKGQPRSLWKAKFLHNYPKEDNDGEVLALDAALRTSAAPTYFPSYQGCVDGGLVANNPSMCAVAKAVKAGVPLEDIVVLSVGTGTNPECIEGDRNDWGYSQWALRFLPLVSETGIGLGDYQCQEMLGERYRRLNVFFEEPIALDAVDRVDDMIEMAESADLKELIAWLRRFVPERDSRYSVA